VKGGAERVGRELAGALPALLVAFTWAALSAPAREALASPGEGGAVAPVLSDVVFDDLDGDGIREGGEGPLAGVVVDLYRDDNGDGRLDSGDPFVRSVTTEADGRFTLPGVEPGPYILHLTRSRWHHPALAGRPCRTVFGVPRDVKVRLDRIWGNRRQYFIDSLRSGLAALNPYVLYNVQLFTNNHLRYAAAAGDTATLDDLADVYLTSFDYLREQTHYVYYYWPGYPRESVHELEAPARMWTGDPALTENGQVGVEYILVSSQFLYAVANLINAILDLPPERRTPRMDELVSSFAPVILVDHYDRWIFAGQGIFQVRGWGGEVGLYNHREFLEKKLNREFGTTVEDPVSYLNAVTDTDMWILAGVVEMLAAHDRDPDAVPMSSQERERLLEYVGVGLALIADRLSPSDLTDFVGVPVTGLNFDLGAWDDHSGHAYSGYTGDTSPLGQPPMPAENTGWDVSHARRFVHVFETLHRRRSVTGASFPDSTVMRGIANQLAYGAFNKSLETPLLANYMDGTNGWYRVGYHGETDPGYPPYGLTTALATGGYGFWSEFNDDVGAIRDALIERIGHIQHADLSGNGRDLTLSGAARADWPDNNGAPRGYVTFDGVDDYFDAGGDRAFATPTGTVEFWFRPTRTGIREDLVNIYENSYQDYLLIGRSADDRILVWVEDDDAVIVGVNSVAHIATGEWNHVAVTQDGSGVRIFINGVESAVTGVNSGRWTQHLYVRGAWFGKSHWSTFSGDMDDVRIYDAALPADEIARHARRDCVVAEWSFDAPDEGYLIFNASLTPDGKNGGAVAFDGEDDYIRAYPDPAMASAAGTISFWIRPDRYDRDEDLVHIAETNYYDYLLIRRLADGAIYVRIEDDDLGKVSITSTEKLTVGLWNHVAVTQDGAGVKIYVNGHESAVSGTNSAFWTGHLDIKVARVGTGAWLLPFKGLMDDLCILSCARPPGVPAPPASDAHLLARWEFDEPREAAVADFVTSYYGISYGASDSLNLLMFLPTFLERQAVAAAFVADQDEDVTITVTLRRLGVSVEPALLDFGILDPGQTVISPVPCAVTNTGNDAEDVGLRIKEADSLDLWTAASAPGADAYSLSARLGETAGVFGVNDLLSAASQPEWCDGTRFGGGGHDLPAGEAVKLWLQFKAPTAISDDGGAPHHVTIEVSCRAAE